MIHDRPAYLDFLENNMSINALSPDFAVTGQITPADVPALVAAGYRSVICNRPDGESHDQPAYAEVARAAAAAGLQIGYLPVVSGQVTPADGQAMADLLRRLPAPVLAYCRSGARSTTLWSLAQQTLQAR